MKLEIELDELLKRVQEAYQKGFNDGFNIGKVQTISTPTVTWGPGVKTSPTGTYCTTVLDNARKG